MKTFTTVLAVLFAGLALMGCSGASSDRLITDAASTPVVSRANYQSNGRKAGAAGTVTSNTSLGRGLRVVKSLPPPPRTKGGQIQPISKGDEMEVVFFGIKKLDRTVRVSATGMISMPLIGSVKAEGKTVRELEVDLEKRYGRSYLQNPQISINVKEALGQRVTVNGEVRRPGIYPIGPRASLLQALALAKGFTELGDPGKVYVFRTINGEKYVAHYDVDRIRNGAQRDPRIYGNDVVVTFSSTAKVAVQNLKDILGIARNATSLALLP